MVTFPSGRLYFTPLCTRFANTCRSRSRSPGTIHGPGPTSSTRIFPPCRVATGVKRVATSCARSRRSTGAVRSATSPDSSVARSSISSAICTRWSTSTSICEARSFAPLASPRSPAVAIDSASSRMVLSGVRSSCERLSTNSVRICRRRTTSVRSRRRIHAPSSPSGAAVTWTCRISSE